MTVIFDVEDLYLLKRLYPSWVFLLGDKSKNPSRLVGSWKDIVGQSMQDLEALVANFPIFEKIGIESWRW